MAPNASPSLNAILRLGSMQLDDMDDSVVAQFRAKLVKDKLSEKRINNVLAVLSKSLR